MMVVRGECGVEGELTGENEGVKMRESWRKGRMEEKEKIGAGNGSTVHWSEWGPGGEGQPGQRADKLVKA